MVPSKQNVKATWFRVFQTENIKLEIREIQELIFLLK